MSSLEHYCKKFNISLLDELHKLWITSPVHKQIQIEVDNHMFWRQPHVYQEYMYVPKAEEYTGGSSSYYMVTVTNPTTLTDPYDAECNDIIEALQMSYAEGNAFKAIWRRCAARLGKKKKGYDNGLYDAEKVEFFGKRMVEQSKPLAKEQLKAKVIADLDHQPKEN